MMSEDTALIKSVSTASTRVDADRVFVVSGLPRSGTSMMMRVLEAGGIAPLTDEIRAADIDNPKGYFELERVKRLPQGDVGWLQDARGKCVKVISALLTYLPPTYNYSVIFMRRRIEEVLESQRKMLARRNQPAPPDEDSLAALLEQHARDTRAWLVNQPNVAVFEADYNAMLAAPVEWVERLAAFLGGALDHEAMRAAVDAALYRNRRP